MEYDSNLTLNELLDTLTAASNLKHLRLDGIYVERSPTTTHCFHAKSYHYDSHPATLNQEQYFLNILNFRLDVH